MSKWYHWIHKHSIKLWTEIEHRNSRREEWKLPSLASETCISFRTVKLKRGGTVFQKTEIRVKTVSVAEADEEKVRRAIRQYLFLSSLIVESVLGAFGLLPRWRLRGMITISFHNKPKFEDIVLVCHVYVVWCRQYENSSLESGLNCSLVLTWQ